MESIAERSVKYGNMMYEKHINDDFANGCETGYEDGATEQKKIDIEKAIDVIENIPQGFSRQMIIDALIEVMDK